MCAGVRVFIYLHMASYMYVYRAMYAHAYNIKMIYIRRYMTHHAAVQYNYIH